MKTIEFKKNLQKTKATLIFSMVFLVLFIPLMAKSLSMPNFFLYLAMSTVIGTLLTKRIKRLSQKINSLTEQ